MGWIRNSLRVMSDRSERHYALVNADEHLQRWRDHGNQTDLEVAIAILRSASNGTA